MTGYLASAFSVRRLAEPIMLFLVPFETDLSGEQILREQEQLQTMLRLSSTCVSMVMPQLPSGLAGFANGVISVTMITT